MVVMCLKLTIQLSEVGMWLLALGLALVVIALSISAVFYLDKWFK